MPFSAVQFLYNGISKQIDCVEQLIDDFGNDDLIEKQMKGIYEAIQYYRENAIISASHLEEKFEQLKAKYVALVSEKEGSY